MTTKLPSTLESFLVAQFRDNPPTGTPIPDPDPYAVTFSKTIAVVGGLAVTYDEVAEQVVLDGSGIAPSPVAWVAVSGGTYFPPSSREQWLLLNDSSNVQLNADVRDGDVVVAKLTFSPDTGPTISSLNGSVVFEYPSGSFTSSVELDVAGQTVRWKYTVAAYPGHANAYVLFGTLGT